MFLYEEWHQAELFLADIVTYDDVYKENGIVSNNPFFYIFFFTLIGINNSFDFTNNTWLPKYYEGLQNYACVMKNYKYFIQGSKYNMVEAERCSANLTYNLKFLGPYMNTSNENGYPSN